jgi:hypothetical protein
MATIKCEKCNCELSSEDNVPIDWEDVPIEIREDLREFDKTIHICRQCVDKECKRLKIGTYEECDD